MDLKDKTVLVTGATGFIGSRLVEILIRDYQCEVKVLVRDLSKLSYICRYPVQVIQGSLDDETALKEAVLGVDYVFNLAAAMGGSPDEFKRINVDAVGLLLKISKASKVKKVIHASTLSVYGNVQEGVLDENIPGAYGAGIYGDTKLDGENLALQFSRDNSFPVVVIQPTIVYGPFGKMWTLGRMQILQKSKVLLINEGNGICNPVYVDDVIQGLIKAVLSDEGHGERFLISGSPTSWLEFWKGYESVLGVKGEYVSMGIEEALRFYKDSITPASILVQLREIFKDQELRHKIRDLPPVKIPYLFVKKILPKKASDSVLRQVVVHDVNQDQQVIPEKPLLPYHPDEAKIYSVTARVSIEKARNLLGYEPVYDLENGMREIKKWVKWYGVE